MMKSLQILEALTKSSIWCLMCYISGQEIMLKTFLQKKKKNLQINPVHIFLSGSGGTGKSHLVKTIYQVVSKVV